ncbi:MAG TPA: M1 family aminopeptidase [Thermoanaerobaculia bacterium]|nr:M1 family aminopeptidase [Thermoanaerobaculia bacterium]
MQPRVVLPSSLLVLALFASAPGRGATLTERAAQIDAPTRGGVLTLSGPIQVGRAEIVPAKGTLVRSLMAGGVPCGLVVEGPAQLVYRVEDRFTLPVAERNVRRLNTLTTKRKGDVLEISDELSGAVIWGWGLGEAGAASGAGLPDWASKLLAGRRFTPPSHDLLATEANGQTGARYALLRGEAVEMLVHVDPRAREENLFRLAKMTDPGQTFREGIQALGLVAQPVERAWWERPAADLVAEQERLSVENPKGEMLKLVSRSRLRSRRAGTALWQADLLDRVYDDDGRRYPITVRSVTVDGRPAEFLHGNDELLVALGRQLADRETVEVEVTYDGALAQRFGGNSFWVLGTEPWYPRQGLEGELATIEITVDVPEGLIPFASGQEVSRAVEGGRRRLTTRLDKPMQAAVVTAGKYRVMEKTQGGTTCRAATYAMMKEDAARDAIERFFMGRKFFEDLFAEPYPFRDFAIVEINEWGFGQAPPGILFFAREFYTAPVDRRTRGFFQDLNSRYFHEVSHGWWGHVAKMASPDEAWLVEAFSDYTAALAIWYLFGKGRGDYEFNEIVKDWYKSTSEIRPGASLYLSYRLALHDERDVTDLLSLHYAKGPLVIHAIRLELQKQKGSVAEGDRAFTDLLRGFLKRNRYGHTGTRELVAELDKLTGGNWQPWFEKYVYGTEIPPLPKS